MSTATATRPQKTRKKTSEFAEVESLRSQLDDALAELQRVNGFFSEIQVFTELVSSAKNDLKSLTHREHDLKEELSEVRAEIRSTKDLIQSCNDGMLAIIEPGPKEFMPMFDRMAKADPKTHGKDAGNWRERPIGVLRLSPSASMSLIDADIVFIGQLQDMILADPDLWWQETAGLTDAIAAAIADKLNDFIAKGGKS